jgi:hypothetical protein
VTHGRFMEATAAGSGWVPTPGGGGARTTSSRLRGVTGEEEEQRSGGGDGVTTPYPRCHHVAAGILLSPSRGAHVGALPLCGCMLGSC